MGYIPHASTGSADDVHIETVSHHRSEGYLSLTGFFNELLRQLRLGGKIRIVLAIGQPFGSRIG